MDGFKNMVSILAIVRVALRSAHLSDQFNCCEIYHVETESEPMRRGAEQQDVLMFNLQGKILI